MRDHFACPECSQPLRPLVRSLDFFCRGCFTTVVVIDERWSHVMRAGEKAPRLVPTERCRRVRATEPLGRGTEPLAAAAATGVLAS
jgi:hypothetical protein